MPGAQELGKWIVNQWVTAIGLDSTAYSTDSMRRPKATLINKRTKNLLSPHRDRSHRRLSEKLGTAGVGQNQSFWINLGKS